MTGLAATHTLYIQAISKFIRLSVSKLCGTASVTTSFSVLHRKSQAGISQRNLSGTTMTARFPSPVSGNSVKGFWSAFSNLEKAS